MATLQVYAKIDATDYGLLIQTSGFPNAIPTVWFGPAFSGGGPNHFDMREVKVGTSGYGSSDLFAPPLASTADFTGMNGPGADPTFAGGVMSFDNSADRYGYFTFPEPPTDIYVQFQLRVYADDNDPDYHDIATGGSSGQLDGIYNGGGEWCMDGVGGCFGTGPVKDGVTWQTVNLRWALIGPTPLFAHRIKVAS